MMDNSKQISALFAAASSASTPPEMTGLNWLKNDSFAIDVSKQISGQSSNVSRTKRSKDDDKSRHKKKRKRDRESSSKTEVLERKESIYNQITNKTFREEVGLLPEHAFRLDPRPDRSNLGANTLYRLHITRYDQDKTILLTGEKRSKKSESKKLSRYFAYSSKERSFYVKRCGNQLSKELETVEEFIPIIGEQPEIDPQLNQPRSDMKKIETENIFLKQTQEFNRLLRNDSKDIKVWMDFVNFQDKMSEIMYDKNENVTCAILEKKLSILERAIESNPKEISLMVTRLELVGSIWEPDKLNEEWKRMVFLYASNANVWLNYINFVKSHLTYFNVKKVIKIYARCFSNFNNILSGHFMTSRSNSSDGHINQTEIEVINIFSSYVTFLKQTGYTERCIASWQSLLEFNLFPPISLQNSNALIDDWITLFEPFWDSNCPLIGENGSLGWSKVIHKKSIQSNDNDDKSDIKAFVAKKESEILERDEEPGKLWYKLERLRDDYFWYPDRTFDDLEDSDRQVLFDDIKICLFRIKETKSIHYLIEKFFPFFSPPETVQTRIDCAPDYVEANWINIDTFINNVTKSLLSVCPQELKEFIIISHCQIIAKLIDASNKESVKFHETLIKNYLKQEPYQMNLKIWDAFIDYESKVGKKEEALRVYEKALKLCFKRVPNQDFVAFVRNYACFVLKITSLEKITDFNIDPIKFDVNSLMTTLVSCINEDVNKTTPTILLQVTRNYHRNIDQYMNETSNNALSIVNHTFLYSLITFLSSNDIEKVDKIYSDALSRCPDQMHRNLHEDHIQLHILNLKCNFGSCRDLLNILHKSLVNFPMDGGFLSLLTTINSNSTGNSSARVFFSRPAASSASKCEDFWLNAIRLEFNRLELVRSSQNFDTNVPRATVEASVGGIPRRIRSIFERALSPRNLPQSFILWKLFISFEFNAGERDKCRDVVYRSLQACPWMKEMYLMFVKYFPSLVQESVDLMTEKEMRIRTLVEELNLVKENRSDVMSSETEKEGK